MTDFHAARIAARYGRFGASVCGVLLTSPLIVVVAVLLLSVAQIVGSEFRIFGCRWQEAG